VKRWNGTPVEKDRVKTKIVEAFENDGEFPFFRVQCLLKTLDDTIGMKNTSNP